MSKIEATELMVNGVKYVPASSIPPKTPAPKGTRAVIVVDRGWIFAGNVVRKDNRIYLSNACQVWRWESIGFNGMIDDPKSSKVVVKKCADVEIPATSEIFAVPVSDNWGL